MFEMPLNSYAYSMTTGWPAVRASVVVFKIMAEVS